VPRAEPDIARLRDEDTGKQHYDSLGAVDDTLDANGADVLSYRQAQDEAVRWFSLKVKELRGDVIAHDGPYRVRDACAHYLEVYQAGRTAKGNGRNADRVEPTINAHILPTLGDVEVSRLPKRRLQDWLNTVAETPPRVRTKTGETPRYREINQTPDARRRRRSTANRILTVLKAVLNHAFREGLVPSDDAWRLVSLFRGTDSARVRYLTDAESLRLVAATDDEFRPLILAALHTGARYGELTSLVREDFNPDSKTISCGFRSPENPIFRRNSGRAWGRSEQQRPMAQAVEKAGLETVTFHELRHTYASRMLMKGVPLAVVAQQLGHADARMVEKHYAHLYPSFIADTVRAAMGGWDPGGEQVAG